MCILVLCSGSLENEAAQKDSDSDEGRKCVVPTQRQQGDDDQHKSIPIKSCDSSVEKRHAGIVERRNAQEYPRPPRILPIHRRDAGPVDRDPSTESNSAQDLEHAIVNRDNDEENPQRAVLDAPEKVALLIRKVEKLSVPPMELLFALMKALRSNPPSEVVGRCPSTLNCACRGVLDT